MKAYLDWLDRDGRMHTAEIPDRGLAFGADLEAGLTFVGGEDARQAPYHIKPRGYSVHFRALRPGAWYAGEPVSRLELDNNAELSIEDVMVRFRRVPARPMVNGVPTHEISLTNLSGQRLLLGRAPTDSPIGEFQPRVAAKSAEPVEATRWDLDSIDEKIGSVHVAISTSQTGDGFDYADRSDGILAEPAELNSMVVEPTKLVFGDRLRIRDYHFDFTGRSLRWIDPHAGGSVRARNLEVAVPTRVGPLTILRGVSLGIRSGEFIGVLGGSGQGKSTLVNALCGINPATKGEVEIGGVPLKNREDIRSLSVGYVPQDDLVHRELTVEDAIRFSARLRFRLDQASMRDLVHGVMERMVLTEHASKRISQLSGGQRKRVSIATEILAKPSVLFLDEPSSGLDPEIERKLMVDLQSLAKAGITVIATTHVLLNAHVFNRICFIHDGRLMFMGTVAEAGRFFFPDLASDGRRTPLEEIYRKLLDGGREETAEIESAFKASAIAARQDMPFPPPPPVIPGPRRAGAGPGWLMSLWLLVCRQWRIITSDRANVAFLFAQALLIGSLVGWVSDDVGFRMFLAIIATMWFGCSNAAQQIVGELPIFRRERVSGLGLNCYIQSKFAFLFGITGVQAVLLWSALTAVAGVAHPVAITERQFAKALAERESYTAAGSQSSKSEEPPDSDNQVGIKIAAEEKEYRSITETEFSFPYRVEEIEELTVNIVRDKSEPNQKSGKLTPSDYTVKTEGSGLIVSLHDPLHYHDLIMISAPKPLIMSVGDRLIWWLVKYGSLEMNVADSGDIQVPERLTMSGKPLISRGLTLWKVVGVAMGLRFLALLLAALVGVALGLMISALAQSATQAVLWVPLILIPQILMGGFVVTLPEMNWAVRSFSSVMPSFAAERLMEVSLIFGQRVPKLSNQTKIANFLSNERDGRANETIRWVQNNIQQASDYEKVSPHNTAWQNLTIDHSNVGRHVQDQGSGGGKPNSVKFRGDVRFGYKWRALFSDTGPTVSAIAVLLGWVGVCYGTIAWSLTRKQYGK